MASKLATNVSVSFQTYCVKRLGKVNKGAEAYVIYGHVLLQLPNAFENCITLLQRPRNTCMSHA